MSKFRIIEIVDFDKNKVLSKQEEPNIRNVLHLHIWSYGYVKLPNWVHRRKSEENIFPEM